MAEHETEPSAKRRRLPQPTPKHTIFLSHSGNEKDFVEQLHEDLKRMNQNPFFDQDSDSLPKGDKFPPTILSAAEQCLLAVVVLSEGYLRSKWPMLELSTFVKSMKGAYPKLKLFPLFYKLSPSDISAERVETQWRESWMKLVQEGKVSAEEIASWGDVVRELRAYNGLEFGKYGTSEVKYRKAVVEEICNKVPSVMKYKTDDIRGYGRLCEITSKMFEEGTSEEMICREGCYYLGLYGLGGVGKSTLCRAMCSYFQEEYGLSVCYLELPTDAEEQSAEKGRVSRIKSILRGLSGLDTRIVNSIDSESQGLECLRMRLEGQPAVFLAVDNVGDLECSREEARGLVKIVVASGSKVMVTSRSRAILDSIFGEEKYCKPISRLKRHEARELFLSVAAPKKLICRLQPCEDEIVEACLMQCRFEEDGYTKQQYHPLVLRALGSYYHDVDKENIMKWKEHISFKNKLQECRESKRVNDIVGLNYLALSDMGKLVFLDVALLLNYTFMNDWSHDTVDTWDYERKVSFIATLHGISPIMAERKVKDLQRKSLVYEGGLKLHDLYIEFAQSLVMKEGSKEREWWVHSVNWTGGINAGLVRRFCVESIEMISIYPIQLQQCEKLECLICVCQDLESSTFDLGCLKSLRVLILNVAGLEEIVCSSRGDGNRGYLPNLKFVKLEGVDLKQIPFLRECYNLKSLSISAWVEEMVVFIEDEPEIFEKLKALEELYLDYLRIPRCEMALEGFLSCASSLQSLKILEIVIFNLDFELRNHDDLWIPQRIDLSPLGALPELSALILIVYDNIEVQGLGKLAGLMTLKLECNNSTIEGVEQLSKLTSLDLSYCKKLCLLPNLSAMPSLQEVCVYDCCSLEDSTCPWKNYKDIKHDPLLHQIDHECHLSPPFCNWINCEVCMDRHRRIGVICQQGCTICKHFKFYPRGCKDKYCKVCKPLFARTLRLEL